jgi:hypothetical protein
MPNNLFCQTVGNARRRSNQSYPVAFIESMQKMTLFYVERVLPFPYLVLGNKEKWSFEDQIPQSETPNTKYKKYLYICRRRSPSGKFHLSKELLYRSSGGMTG